jgi:hypothetical protein
LCWVGAVAAGGVETVLAVADRISTGAGSVTVIVAQVVVRLAVFTVALALAGRVWNGRNWARWALAGVLVVVGTLSLAGGPMRWLTGLESSERFAAFAVVLAVHLVALAGAVVLMFLPAANRYFRSGQAFGAGKAFRTSSTTNA